ncbi:GNAT family N-acetyltransferase [Aeromonas caviae]|uniref:GNAT family N-acetyltransferase n=1 Tax=Aeromonas caviae TaxID=648 RepID=UPI002B4945B4|nr:GNAT family protein [Aeromonas caviae]
MNTDKIILKKKLDGQESSITIRNMIISDITETYCDWLNDNEVNHYLESRFTKWDINSLLKYYHDKSGVELLLAIIDNNSGAHIGNVKVSSIDKHHRRADIGIIIGDKKFWGKGIATEAIELVTNYCFSTLQLHKVTAGAYAENKASINAFMKNGFLIEGERREHYITEAGWTSAILLGKINNIS